MGEVMAIVRDRLPADAILTNGAGNFSVWAHRFYEFRRYPTQLAPTSGAMGYGVPAAVAAKLSYPERAVVAMAGDGDFLMTGQELATAVQVDAAIVVLVVNNGMYGTIRMHQERQLPGSRLRHRSRQPRLRGARAGLRRARCPRRTDAGLRGRLRGGARLRTTRSDRATRRPGGPDTPADADGDPRRRRVPGSPRRRIAQTPTANPEEHSMAKSYASTVIGASPDEVWAHIRDFNGLATWHSGLVAAERDRGRQGGRPGRRDPQLHADRRDAHPGAAARALRSRSVVHLRLSEDAVRRRQLLRHDPGHSDHRRGRQLRRVVDDVRLRPGSARALDGLLRQPGLPGRLRRAQVPLRLTVAGSCVESCASRARPSRSRTSRTPSRRAASCSSPASFPSTSSGSSSAATTSSRRRAACSRTCAPCSRPAAARSPTSSR